MLHRWSGTQSISLRDQAMRLLRLPRRPRRLSASLCAHAWFALRTHLGHLLGNTFCAFLSPAAPTVSSSVQGSANPEPGSPIPPSPSTFTQSPCVGLRVTHPASYAERMCPCELERCRCEPGNCPRCPHTQCLNSLSGAEQPANPMDIAVQWSSTWTTVYLI
jgi:hypothetical protein